MHTPQRNAPGKIFVLASLIVGLSFYINSELPEAIQLKADQLGAIYTGLGIAGLVAPYWHQREESEESNREHIEVLGAMKKQSEIAAYNAKLSATIAKRARCIDEAAMLKGLNHTKQEKLLHVASDLDTQIDEMVDKFPR